MQWLEPPWPYTPVLSQAAPVFLDIFDKRRIGACVRCVPLPVPYRMSIDENVGLLEDIVGDVGQAQNGFGQSLTLPVDDNCHVHITVGSRILPGMTTKQACLA